jgi:hypothetical protein
MSSATVSPTELRSEPCMVQMRRGNMLLSLRVDEDGPVLWFVATALEIQNVRAAPCEAEDMAQPSEVLALSR